MPAYLQQSRVINLLTLLQVESLHHVSYQYSHPLLLPLSSSLLLLSCCLTLSPPAPDLVPICLELHQFNSLNEQNKAYQLKNPVAFCHFSKMNNLLCNQVTIKDRSIMDMVGTCNEKQDLPPAPFSHRAGAFNSLQALR